MMWEDELYQEETIALGVGLPDVQQKEGPSSFLSSWPLSSKRSLKINYYLAFSEVCFCSELFSQQ